MKIIEDASYMDIAFPKISKDYFADLKIGVLDIETTGLNPDLTKVILGGLASPCFGKEKRIKHIQYFAESLAEEKGLLEAYTAELKSFDILITYNGARFDLPFLQKRLLANKLPLMKLYPSQSFDLYLALNKYSSLRKILPNLKQKTVETYMGLWANRDDEISGSESVDMYFDYLSNKNPDIFDIIMLHNKDDLLQLSRLMQITSKLDLHEIMYRNGFVVPCGEKRLYINTIKQKNDFLEISGAGKNIFLDYKAYEENYYSDFSVEHNTFNLKIPFYPQGENLDYGQINRKIKRVVKEILCSL